PDVAVDLETAVDEALQAGHASQDGGLPATRGAEQCGDASRGHGEGGVEREAAERSFEGRVDRVGSAHNVERATRFSISIMARITTKANMTIPAARIVASRHCDVST